MAFVTSPSSPVSPRAVAILSAAVAAACLISSADASTYIYSRNTTSTDNWSTGDGWDTVPVSGFDTRLVFGTDPGPLQLGDRAGIALESINDIPSSGLNAEGRFELNQFYASYKGLSVNSGTPLVVPTVHISGGPLEFLNNDVTTPVMSIRADSNSSGTVQQKAQITIDNDLFVRSSAFTILGQGNFAGGVASGAINLTGGLAFLTTESHTLELGGNASASVNSSPAGHNVLAASIVDQSNGNATSLIKSGTSYWNTLGTNTYTGDTTISGGVLQVNTAQGFGGGAVTVANGASAFANGDLFDNEFSIAGTNISGGALRLGANTVITHTITLTGDARISNEGNTSFATISGKIVGDFGVTFGSINNGSNSAIAISNHDNAWAGDTTLTGDGTSGGTRALRLDNDEVIPNGVNFGNVVFASSQTGGHVARLDLNGHTETVNALVAALPQSPSAANADGGQLIRNGAVGDATLIIGDADAGGSFVGQLTNGAAGKLNLIKTGGGTQVLAGRSSHTGTTDVQGGALVIDFNQFAPVSGGAALNYFSTGSDLTLDGSTFGINGRTDGKALSKDNVNFTAFTTYVDITDEEADGLVPGQPIDLTPTTGDGTKQSGAMFIVGLENISGGNTRLYLNTRDTGNSKAAVGSIDITATTATTTQNLKSLTLAGDLAETSTIDFGESNNVVLTIGAITQTNDGSLLRIANWSGDPVNGGGADQLLFTGVPGDFTSQFNLAEVVFDGYAPGYQIIDGGSFYEVIPTAVPEPTSVAALAGLAGLLLRRRPRRTA